MPTYGAVEDYQDDELVVALLDIDVVEKALNDLQVAIHGKDPDERLGLVLLSLGADPDQVTEAAAALQRKDPGLIQRVADAKWPGRLPRKPEGRPALDVLLYQLRADIAANYGGWMPEVGK